MKNGTFSGKTVIITGAASGIGKALAAEFGRREANLVIADKDEKNLLRYAAALKPVVSAVLPVNADVSAESDCRMLAEAAISHFGRIDVLVNNAGISMRALFKEVDLTVIRRVMDVNFWGTVYCTKYALPSILENHGSVVGISSIAGYKGLPGRTGYSASKFAIHGFLEVLRIENRKKNLHVLIACPGFTSTNIRNTALNKNALPQGESPLNESKLMSPGKVATKIVKAITQRKPTLILTFQGKLTVFLNKFFPSFMDKMVYNHMAKEPDSPFK